MNKYIDMSRAFVALGESAPPTRGSTNQIPGKAMKQRVWLDTAVRENKTDALIGYRSQTEWNRCSDWIPQSDRMKQRLWLNAAVRQEWNRGCVRILQLDRMKQRLWLETAVRQNETEAVIGYCSQTKWNRGCDWILQSDRMKQRLWLDTAVRQNETEALIGYMQSLNKAYKNSKNQVIYLDALFHGSIGTSTIASSTLFAKLWTPPAPAVTQVG